MKTKKTAKKIDRNKNARNRRKKSTTPRKRRGSDAKREELLLQAQTLGMDELGWIHGGAISANSCCTWSGPTKCGRQIGQHYGQQLAGEPGRVVGNIGGDIVDRGADVLRGDFSTLTKPFNLNPKR